MLNNWSFFYQVSPDPEVEFTSLYFEEEPDILLEDVREQGRAYMRRFLRTEFHVTGDDFDDLYALLGSSPCADIDFRVKYDGATVWEGKLKLRSAKWFPDTCLVRFTPVINDIYTCVTKNWETEKNMFSVGSEAAVNTFFGTLERETCTLDWPASVPINGFAESNVSSCLDDLSTYSLEIFKITDLGAGAAPNRYRHEVTWVSERATVACDGGIGGTPAEPPGDGWTLISDDCAGAGTATWGRKPAMTYDGQYADPDVDPNILHDNRYVVTGEEAAEYGNGRFLNDLIEAFADDCALSVVSDFFGINGDDTAPANDPYTASERIKYIIVYQKSDIKRPNATNPATIGNMKFKNLLEWLRTMFNVEWNSDGDTLRLEHVSYFSKANGADLTSTQPDAVAGRNAFTFDADGLAPREEFAWSDRTLDADFYGLPILYTEACTDNEAPAETRRADGVYTDLSGAQMDSGNVSDEGFFFMATDLYAGQYYINREAGELSGTIKPNVHLSWANLHENYHKWARPAPSGNLNNVDIDFESYRPTKRQQPIEIDLTPAEYFALNTEEKLGTELGFGEIDRGSYSARRCKYTIDLKFES